MIKMFTNFKIDQQIDLLIHPMYQCLMIVCVFSVTNLLEIENYKRIKKLDDRGQSTVYLCKYKHKQVVLKFYRCNSDDELNEAMKEVINLFILFTF